MATLIERPSDLGPFYQSVIKRDQTILQYKYSLKYYKHISMLRSIFWKNKSLRILAIFFVFKTYHS